MTLGLRVDSQKRAEEVIREILETKEVYYLRKDDGYAEISESNDFEDTEGNPLVTIPFWSKTCIPYARKWGEGLELKEISLEDFKELWLKGMDGDGVILGLNWNQNGSRS